MFAVEFDRYGMILFTPAEVPERVRPEVVDGLGGRIRPGVTLEEPRGVHAWPGGEPAPDAALCVSRSDPDHYEVIRRRQVDPARFEVVPRTYGVIASESGWETFLESLRELNAIAGNASGVEPPDSPGPGEGP